MNVGDDSTNLENTFSAIQQYLTPILLSKIRAYLSLTVRIDCQMPEDIQKVCSNITTLFPRLLFSNFF